jgi:hypothetical protein
MNRRPLIGLILALPLCLAAAICHDGGGTDPEPATGSIEGQVTIDAELASGITVSISGPTSASTTTGSGQYFFDDVPAGAYVVTISGFPSDVVFSTTSQTVTVTDGGAALADFSGRRLRTSGITGTVEADDTGLEGVTVTAVGPDEAETETDAAGSYEIVELRAGGYEVSISGYDGSVYDFTETSQEIVVDPDETVTVTFTGSVSQPSDEVMVGVFSAGVTAPDGIGNLFSIAAAGGGASGARADGATADGFGPFDGRYPLAIAGAEGYVIIDLLDGSVLHEQTDLAATGPFFGIAGITQAPAGDPSSPAMLLAYGENGYTIDRFDQFGVIALDGPTVDAYPAGGDIVSDVMPFVQVPQYGGVQFFQKETGSDVYTPSGEEYTSFDGQPAISAYTHGQGVTTSGDVRGPTLVVTNAANGGLYLLPRSGEGAQRAADLGPDARRVRCIEVEDGDDALVCAVTVFGQDALRTFTWDGAGLPVVADAVAVGDGPVGVSLRRLADGRIAVVTSGFNDSTITELVLGTDGTVEYGQSRSAPAGCVAVANVVYVVDDVSAKVAGACYESGHYFVDDSAVP